MRNASLGTYIYTITERYQDLNLTLFRVGGWQKTAVVLITLFCLTVLPETYRWAFPLPWQHCMIKLQYTGMGVQYSKGGLARLPWVTEQQFMNWSLNGTEHIFQLSCALVNGYWCCVRVEARSDTFTILISLWWSSYASH